MKASELRLFNIVSFEGQHQHVSSIHSDNTIRLSWVIGGECHGCYRSTDKRIQPIPLTEEWLLRFGFKNVDRGILYSKYQELSHDINDTCDAQINIKVHRDLFNMSKILSFEYKFTVIKHVHQLQNLYFALTGEELKIEL